MGHNLYSEDRVWLRTQSSTFWKPVWWVYSLKNLRIATETPKYRGEEVEVLFSWWRREELRGRNEWKQRQMEVPSPLGMHARPYQPGGILHRSCKTSSMRPQSLNILSEALSVLIIPLRYRLKQDKNLQALKLCVGGEKQRTFRRDGKSWENHSHRVNNKEKTATLQSTNKKWQETTTAHQKHKAKREQETIHPWDQKAQERNIKLNARQFFMEPWIAHADDNVRQVIKMWVKQVSYPGVRAEAM